MNVGEFGSHAEKRRKFDAEFRKGAVRIITETGKTVAEVAKDLGINESTLASRVSRARRAGSVPGGGNEELDRHGGKTPSSSGITRNSRWSLMSSNDAVGNAVSEAFKQLPQGRIRPPAHLRHLRRGWIRIATWNTDFHNARRLHSVCGFKGPIDYEHDHRASLTEELAA